MSSPADQERFATATELGEVLDAVYEWTSAHGEPEPTTGFRGFTGDGYPIANIGVIYSADLPVATLRKHVPEHLATLGVHNELRLTVVEPYQDVGEKQPFIVDKGRTGFIVIDRDSDPLAVSKETTYAFDEDDPHGGNVTHLPRRPSAAPSNYAADLIKYFRGLSLERETGGGRITFSEYVALSAITRLWAERYSELSSPGPERRAVWE